MATLKIDDMALQIVGEAPMLWALLDSLLSARALQVMKIKSQGHTEIRVLVSDAQEAEDSEYWAQVDDLEGVIEGITGDCILRAECLASQHSATMMLKSTNQKANSLSIIETMAKMGLSISIDAIHDTVHLLSAESSHALQYLRQTLLAAYAYDNFDINLKSTVPTAEKYTNSLKHLTSGLLFPLQHGVTRDDLKFTGNIQAIKRLMAQGGVFDPVEVEDGESPDVTEYVVLVHGDLGMGEHIASMQQCRSIETTPWWQFQHIVFVPGLFHLKMAAADAIWRALIQPMSACQDQTSLMHDIAQLRPRETGIFGSKPGLRMMHQLIGHDGICRHLDCWQIEVEKMNNAHKTLDDFAILKPSLKELKVIANRLAREYITTYRLTRYKNNLLINKYFLLYEELSYAMNIGDIVHIETCIIAWTLIFKAMGKHKYATCMTEFLINLHFNYPMGLQKAIRYHWLVNPTRKPERFHAVDWCVELNNLFIKVKNGGTGSNRSVARVILESPLVEVYQNAHSVIKTNFMHTGRMSLQAAPDMKKMFEGLLTKMRSSSPHIHTPGRQSTYLVPDLLDKGHELFEKGWKGIGTEDNGTIVDEVEHPTTEDVVGEL
ncbi:uncharacterized protein F5891DRAFT_1128201 [Suillus fuscotomentosus]|uniref:DUF6589 domain-containing protein n=1 Tax=Suillus fuscotomentosus TaxID=1912939 RepID=A0AAD4E7L6_9AGAM|nr:uncharacterized protein F5891DRAFT_1128201 [Suillus fuscotomentosus]KAG1901149.1 hypothetical protein F5891DRAFT_1128201 [Suillus fuscotomentosus]